MQGEVFGRTADGEPVQRFKIKGGGLQANVLTWGAIIQDMRLADHDAPLVLGYEQFEAYAEDTAYFGAVAGRYANRIRKGQFVIDGKHCQADQNFLGKHLLHGGRAGFSSRQWEVSLHGADFVTLALHSPDGDMGFPGAVEVTCTYRLKIPATLSVEFTATSDAPTICNLAQHSYFNLDDGGAGDILDHRLVIPAAAYLPVDDELIPTGVVQPVDGTFFDFRLPRPIRARDEAGEQIPYDHNFCLAAARGPLHRAAWLQGRSGLEMEVWTTEPGLQFYGGHMLGPAQRGLGGRQYKKHAGLCLEPQIWPDSPNRPYFPQATLWPGEIYRQVTEYRFKSG